jgi:CCR4-NOT transcriptional regulation complex NOT5 subunit
VSHFNHCIKWATENDIPWQQVLLLQRLREEAMSEFLQKSKQKKITDFFKND